MTNNTNRAAEAAQPASGDPKAIFKQLWDASQNMLQESCKHIGWTKAAKELDDALADALDIEDCVFSCPAATSGDAPDLQQLKALALAATPGPWTATHWNGHAPTTVMRTGTTMAIAETTGFGRDSSECAPDAAYIAAANPAVILKLLAMLEAKMENNDAK